MARSQNPNSASCQFYITKAPMGQLDRQYAIFGGVVDGINTVYKIGRGDTIISAQIVDNDGGDDRAPMAPQQGFQQQRRGNGASASNAGTPTDSGF